VLTRADERGFTLAELAVAMSLLMLVIGALLAALESGTTAERNASARIDDEQAVQLVLSQLSRDVRNAAPQPSTLPPPPPPPSPLVYATGDEIDLTYADGAAVTWKYSAATGVLQRTFNGTAGVSVGGLTNADYSVFQLLASDGTELVSGAAPATGDTAADVTTCAATVVVSLTSRAHAPAKPFVDTVYAPFDAPAIDRRGCP
jgi:type II secretory pathway pseudopilin PulG